MPALPGYEKYDPYNFINYDEFSNDRVEVPDWTNSQIDKLFYAFVRIQEVAKKHSELPVDYEYLNHDYRSVAQALFDCPVIFSNRISKGIYNKFSKNLIFDHFYNTGNVSSKVDSFKKKYGVTGITYDHECPRNESAKYFIKSYNEWEPLDSENLPEKFNLLKSETYPFELFLRDYLKKWGITNLVTTYENGLLSSKLKKKDFVFEGPKSLYQSCEIDLYSLNNL